MPRDRSTPKPAPDPQPATDASPPSAASSPPSPEAPAARPLPAGPLFPHRAVTPVASGGPMLSSTQALLRRDLWTQPPDGPPVYQRHFSQGRHIEHYITSADPTSQYPEALAEQAARQIIAQFGLPTAYLHLVFAAHAAAQEAPWRDLFRLRGSDLLATLGLDQRTDVPKADLLRELAKQAELLGSLAVIVVWGEGKRDLTVQASRMWDIAFEVVGPGGPTRAWRAALAAPTEVWLTVRPGLWTAKFLNRAGQEAGMALRQFGYLAQSTLRINPYQAPLAAKLAVHLTLMSRLRATYRVQTLLSAVEAPAVLQAALADHRQRARVKRRWDQALLTLQEHGWKLTFDPQTYPLVLRPDWALPADVPAHQRRLPAGYFTQLLAATLTIAPPDPIPALLAGSYDLPAPSRRPAPLPPLRGAAIRQARQAKGWSQRQLAELMSKSQQWVAFLERDQRTLQPEDQTRLQALLELDPTSHP